MDYDLIIRARKALNSLWVIALLKGRCWGPKRYDNPYSATNITFVVGGELVSISQREGTLVVHEFCQAKNTRLGKTVREILRREGIPLEDDVVPLTKAKTTPQEPFFMWGCEKCKRRGTVEYEDGYTLIVVASRLYREHAAASPGCSHTNVRIFDHNMVEQQNFTRYLSLVKVS